MLRRTPLARKTGLKSNTPLKAKTQLKAKTPLKAKTELKSRTPLKAKSTLKQASIVIRTKKREPNYVNDMDTVFQFYIRLRDAMPGGMTRCISCGDVKPFDQMQAGHFHSRRHFSIRWSELNVNSECIYCNCYNGDHLLKYEKNLIRKIGQRKVDWLDAECKNSRKWSNSEIVQMIKYYGRKVLHLSASKSIPVSKNVLDIIRRYEKKKL